MPFRPKIVEELMTAIEPRPPSPKRPAARSRSEPPSVLGLLFIAGIAVKVGSAVLDPTSPPGEGKRIEQWEARAPHDASSAAATAQKGKPMPPDVAAGVRALLRALPEQHDYLIEELRWKEWRVNGTIKLGEAWHRVCHGGDCE